MIQLFSALKLLILAVILTEATARIGAGILALFLRRRPENWERLSLGFFLGWGLAGLAFYGLALTRLFMPGPILTCFACLFLFSRAAWDRKPLLTEAARLFGRLDWIGAGLLSFAGLILAYYMLPRLLVPDLSADTFTYHLGAPWQYLQSRGIQLHNISWAFHLPMLMEMVYTLPLILGDDRLARSITLLVFLAANLYVIGYCLRTGKRDAAWLAPLLCLSTLETLPLLTTCKSDMAAASLFVVGAMLSLSRIHVLGGLFMGACIAVKPVLSPIVAVWWIISSPPLRLFAPLLAALVLPSLGWLIKAYIATGNPLGLAAPWIEALDWGPANYDAWKIYSKLEGKATEWANLPSFWLKSLSRQNILVLLLLPGFALAGRWRKAALACVLGQLVTLKLAAEPRFIFASIWLSAVIAGLALARLSGAWRAAVYALSAFLLIWTGILAGFDKKVWQDAVMPAAEYREKYLTTFEETVNFMSGLKPGVIMTQGEFKTYRFPGRVIFGGTLGETPLIWKLVRESSDVRRLAVKFRQLGANYLCHNYITSELVGSHYLKFTWDRRMARLYAEYFKRYQERIMGTRGNDQTNGGHYVYRVRSSPFAEPLENVWFLPGTESLYWPSIVLNLLKKSDEAIAGSKLVLEIFPDVGTAWNHVGHCYLGKGDAKNAFKYLKPFAVAGMVEGVNLIDYGSAARQIGKVDIAEEIFEKCLPLFPSQRNSVCLELALVNLMRADQELTRGQLEKARTQIRQSEAYLALVEENSEHEEVRRKVMAGTKFYTGLVYAAAGHNRLAASFIRQACGLDPDNESVPQWRVMVERLDPPSGTFGRRR